MSTEHEWAIRIAKSVLAEYPKYSAVPEVDRRKYGTNHLMELSRALLSTTKPKPAGSHLDDEGVAKPEITEHASLTALIYNSMSDGRYEGKLLVALQCAQDAATAILKDGYCKSLRTAPQATQEEGLLASQGRSASAWQPIEITLDDTADAEKILSGALPAIGMQVTKQELKTLIHHIAFGLFSARGQGVKSERAMWELAAQAQELDMGYGVGAQPSPPTQPERPREAPTTSTTREVAQEATQAAKDFIQSDLWQRMPFWDSDEAEAAIANLLTSREAAIEAGVWEKAAEMANEVSARKFKEAHAWKSTSDFETASRLHSQARALAVLADNFRSQAQVKDK